MRNIGERYRSDYELKGGFQLEPGWPPVLVDYRRGQAKLQVPRLRE